MLSKREKYNFLSERAFTAGYDQSPGYDQPKVAPGVDAGIPSAIFGPRESFSRIALERSVRRSTILLPNHFRRLILQFEFARACARNHPLALPAHIPAIKRKWTLDRPISLRSFPSSSCCDIPPSRVSLALPAPLHALFSFSSSIPIISREYV